LVRKGPGCWLWMGRLNSVARPYGRFEKDGKSYLAHRYAWQFSHRISPGRLKIRHSCDNWRCCRPSHLRRGTQKHDSIRAGTHKFARLSGEQHPHAKLNWQAVAIIKKSNLSERVRTLRDRFAIRHWRCDGKTRGRAATRQCRSGLWAEFSRGTV